MSEVGTDIAVPTWGEEPGPVYTSFAQFFHQPPPPRPSSDPRPNWKARQVQRRLDLKGRVTTVYSRLLAELRWAVVAIAHQWQTSGLLAKATDIFYLELDEVRQLVVEPEGPLRASLGQRVQVRRARLEQDRQMPAVPTLVYGNEPPHSVTLFNGDGTSAGQRWQGMGASPGQVQGRIKVMHQVQALGDLPPDTILVVPYTDSGWAPVLARVAGLIAEAGGRLSHGAIVAREYGIPAVMDIDHATQRFQDGQLVRMDGEQGIIELLN